MPITDAQIASEVLDIIRTLEPEVEQTRRLVTEIREIWDRRDEDYRRAWRLYHSLPGADSKNDLRDQLMVINTLLNPLEGLL